jgi:hypothetical protein
MIRPPKPAHRRIPNSETIGNPTSFYNSCRGRDKNCKKMEWILRGFSGWWGGWGKRI